MFLINTYLELVSYDHTDSYFINNPCARYIDIDDSSRIREIIDHRKFTPELIQQLITITYNNSNIVDFNVPSGLDLWGGSYIPALEKYLFEGNSTKMYGIEPVILQFESVNTNQVSFSIIGDWEPKKTFATAILPEKQLIESLLNSAKHFWEMLIEYKVFEEKMINDTTPRDYPYQMIKKIEGLRKMII